jgi:hypothetical protein
VLSRVNRTVRDRSGQDGPGISCAGVVSRARELQAHAGPPLCSDRSTVADVELLAGYPRAELGPGGLLSAEHARERGASLAAERRQCETCSLACRRGSERATRLLRMPPMARWTSNLDTDPNRSLRRTLAASRSGGTHIGRPPAKLHPDVAQRLRELRAVPLGYRRIADQLNAEGLSTPSGATWGTSSVKHWLARAERDQP